MSFSKAAGDVGLPIHVLDELSDFVGQFDAILIVHVLDALEVKDIGLVLFGVFIDFCSYIPSEGVVLVEEGT